MSILGSPLTFADCGAVIETARNPKLGKPIAGAYLLQQISEYEYGVFYRSDEIQKPNFVIRPDSVQLNTALGPLKLFGLSRAKSPSGKHFRYPTRVRSSIGISSTRFDAPFSEGMKIAQRSNGNWKILEGAVDPTIIKDPVRYKGVKAALYNLEKIYDGIKTMSPQTLKKLQIEAEKISNETDKTFAQLMSSAIRNQKVEYYLAANMAEDDLNYNQRIMTLMELERGIRCV